MDAKQRRLQQFMPGLIRLNVPIYQRKYNWSLDECKQLFNDIKAIGEDDSRKNYFIGSIVIKIEPDSIYDDYDKYTLIDGQQRLTTITLIYCAICNYYKNIGEKDICRNIYTNYLVNNDIDNTIKLTLTENDNILLKYIIESIDTDKESKLKPDKSINIYTNYEFFENQINKDNIEIIRKGLKKLVFITVGLDPDDNAQLIFESLNSTGLELNQNDLIRNYVLMGLDLQKQNYLYKNYWSELEEGFINEDKLFDDFIRYYLTINNNGNPIVKRHLYKHFKSYAKGFDEEELVKDILKFANYFFNIKFEREEDPELLSAFQSFNKLNVNMPFPFLLEAYDDYKNSENNPDINLTKEEFINIVKFVESYCLRRSICGMDTKSLNYTFAKLTKEINKKDYYNYFIAAMLSKTENKRFPNNNELEETLITQNMFSKDVLRYILDTIENSNDKYIVDTSNCTIEHVMPQTLSKEWKIDLGENWKEIHEVYLDTIGNLTLTPYNSEYSNKRFIVKKTCPQGFIKSKLYLNSYLAELDSWGKEEIINRAKQLSNQIINIWKYPVMTEKIIEIIDFKKNVPGGDIQEYTLDDFDNLEEKSFPRQLFDALNMKILKLDSNINQSIRKQYIAYRKNKNFVEIVPQKKRLQLSLDIPYSELNDTEGKCKDISYKGRWGTGETRVYLTKESDIEYIMDLIKQSYEYNLE